MKYNQPKVILDLIFKKATQMIIKRLNYKICPKMLKK